MRDKKEGSVLGIPEAFLYPYRVIGDKIARLLPLFEDLRLALVKANMKVAFQAYVAFIIFFSSIAFFAVMIPALIIASILGAPMLLAALLSIALGLLAGSITFIALYFYPSTVVNERKRALEEELPYVASHMAVLAKAGLPPERIFRSLAMLEARGLKSAAAEEAKNIIRDVDLLGLDIISAMEAERERSPSPSFSDFIDGIIGVARSGGDLAGYFLSSAKAFMDSARISARKLVDTLGTIAEAYVAMLVVFPLVAIIMLAIMGIIGGSLGGFSITTIMYLISYILLPFLSMMILLLLDGIMPKR